MQLTAAVNKDNLGDGKKRGDVAVSVIGCDRTGLATACLIAEAGYRVFCIDFDQSLIDHIRRGKLPFNNAELESSLRKNVNQGRLLATTEIKDPLSKSNIILLFIRSRVDEKGRPDYSNVQKICKSVGLNLHPDSLIILNASLAPGTTETLIREELETASGLRAGVDFGLAYCSIRSTPGRELEDISGNPKVFGAVDERSAKLTRTFLSTIMKGDIIELNDIKTAEAVRLFESVCKEMNIALVTELAHFCEEYGIDFMQVWRTMNNLHHNLPLPGALDEQISEDSCLLIKESENLKIRFQIAKLARKVNDDFINQVFYLVKDAIRSCNKTVRRAKVLVLGVSCQPNVKEIEGSFVKKLVEFLENKGMIVKVYDPLFSYGEMTDLGYPSERTLTKALAGTDCLLIAVGHDRFKRLNLQRMKLLMKKPSAIVDMSYVVDPAEVEEKGFVYRGLGRGVWTRWKN